ncbi:MAG: aromatic amino acid transport family protein, partial [Cyanobacteria bacterium J06650_10]
GSCIPLVMFALWNTVILASIPLSYQQTGSVDPLEWMRTGATYPELKIAVSVFSELAIATSFIGFVFGLLDVFEDIFSPTLIKQNRKLFFYLLTFVPPLLLSLINPNVFYEAIDFAGAFGISILFGIIPALMVWRLRGENTPSVPLLVGGRPLLMGMIAIAIGVMLQKIASFGN